MLPYPWRLSIAVTRAALGGACLVLYAGLSRSPIPWALIPILGFVLYSFFAIRRAMESGASPLATLIIDTAAFILWVVFTTRAGYSGMSWFALNVAIYVFLLSSAILTQEWPKVLAVAAVSIVAVLVVQQPGVPLQATVIWCSVMGVAWVLHRRYLETRLDRAGRHSVQYRFEAQHSREEERQRIAADFHDGPLQSFIGFQMRLEIVKKLLARDPALAAEEVKQLQELCLSQVGELRAFVRSMRPADVEGSSLGASISRMVEQFQKDTGIMASFLSSEHLEPSETEVSLEVLQIVREALNNVQKHSRATRVAVSLAKKGDFLEIGIDDNGVGFPFAGAYNLDELDLLRLGPVSIRRRVKALGGEMQVESKPGQGAGLKVRVAIS